MRQRRDDRRQLRRPLQRTADKRVLVHKWVHIDRPPVGEDGPNDDLNVRGLQGVPDERLVTCRYTTGSGNVVVAGERQAERACAALNPES